MRISCLVVLAAVSPACPMLLRPAPLLRPVVPPLRSSPPQAAEPKLGIGIEARQRLLLLVQDLASRGATQAQIEGGVSQAVAAVFAPPPPPAAAAAAVAGVSAPAAAGSTATGSTAAQLVVPATASDAHKALRASFGGRYTVAVSAATQKFLNFIVEDRTCVFRWRYSRVYAVGFHALCDAFLRGSCRTAADEAATRAALCVGLGLDQAAVWADAASLCEEAAGLDRQQLLATEEFRQIAAAQGSLKYTYTFGVGLVMLMRAVGETELSPPPRTVTSGITAWCTALDLRFATRLASDYTRPLSIDGIGRFDFYSESGLEDASLVSIGQEGSF